MALSGHAGHVDAVAFSPSGDKFASAGAERTIRVWNAASDACTHILMGHTARVQSLSFSSDGSTLASASFDGTVKLWNSESAGPIVRTADCCNLTSQHVAISSDFRYLALLGSLDEVCVRRLDDGSLVGTLPLASNPCKLQFLSDRPVLFGMAVGSPDSVDEWDVESWKSVDVHRRPDETVMDIARWGDCLIADLEGATRLTDTRAGRQSEEFEKPRRKDGRICAAQLVLSPDGTCLAIGQEGGAEIVLNSATHGPGPLQPQVVSPQGGEGPLHAVSNGAKLLARQHGNYSIAIVESRSGHLLATLRHPDFLVRAAFSPDGKTLATCCGDRTVYLWNVASGQEVARLATRPSSFVSLQFSSDGRRLAAVSSTDVKVEKTDFTYPDGNVVHGWKESTAVVTIWSGVGGP